MLKMRSSIWVKAIIFAIFFVIIILHLSSAIDISIKNAVPFTVLPLLVAYSVFSTPLKSFFVGLVCGICVDSVAVGAYCFNTFFLMLTALIVCLTANNLFNKNIWAALVISLITAILYFMLNWLIFYMPSMKAEENLTYILSYGFPSAVYTALFVLPFYYLFKYLNAFTKK